MSLSNAISCNQCRKNAIAIIGIMPERAGIIPERSQRFCRHFQKKLNPLHRTYEGLFLIMPERAGTMPECWESLKLKAELYFVS
jgi:hypothetical protein